VEGYAEYATYRPHLAYLRDPYGDPDVEMELDGVGGVSILAKAKVFRYGGHFPAFSFEKHAETEGFGKVSLELNLAAWNLTNWLQMARKMGLSVIGLPHYTIWHAYEPSVDDIKHMEVSGDVLLADPATEADKLQQMKREQLAQEQAEKEKAEKAKKMKESFGDTTGQWEKDKASMQNIAAEEKKKEAAAAAAAGAAVANNKAAQAAAAQEEEKVVAENGAKENGKT
jgi:mannan polymerase II complex ANP1 subunit